MNETLNRQSVFFCYFSILIFPLNMVLVHVVNFLNLEWLTNRTIFICYAMVVLYAAYLVMRFPMSLKRIVLLFSIYMVYLLFYVTGPSKARSLYLDVDMLLNYVYYLPFSTLILSRIENFEELFTNKWLKYCNIATILLAFFIKYQLNDSSEYMFYSYSLLPFWLLFSFDYIEKPTVFKTGVAMVMLLEGIMYGARGPIVWLFSGIVWYLFLKFRHKKIKLTLNRLIHVTAISVGIFAFIFILVNSLSFFNIDNSYILRRLSTGVLYDSAGRNSLSNIAIEYLGKMGSSINGVFFDRMILPNGIYVHNVFLEILLAFGWVFGPVMILISGYFLLKVYHQANVLNKKVMIFILASFLLKFIVTGSIFMDRGFIIALALIYAIYKQQKPDRFIIMEKL